MRRCGDLRRAIERIVRSPCLAIASATVLTLSLSARADEGGVPFWFSGQYASLAAVPATPGWSSAAAGLLLQRRRVARQVASSRRQCRAWARFAPTVDPHSADLRARHETVRRPTRDRGRIRLWEEHDASRRLSVSARYSVRSKRFRVGLDRPVSSCKPRMGERERQLDGVSDRRHPGRVLRQQAAREHRHRSRCD